MTDDISKQIKSMTRSSFSQNILFTKCRRSWYYKYVKKLPVVSDMMYADAGSVIHKTLENYYNGKYKTMQETKDSFLLQWKLRKLPGTALKNRIDNYWLMIINGINLNLKITTAELKIFWPDVVGYLDIVNTDTDEIYDWKSSTRSAENEKEYTHQLKFYAYLYYRKFNRIPKKVGVFYLKYSGSKGELIIEPTEKDINEMETWHLTCLFNMDRVKLENKVPKLSDDHFFFCPYKNICETEINGKLKYDLYLDGNYIYINGPITDLLNKGITNKFSYELKNAYFIKKANPNARTTISFWDSRKRRLPIGFLSGLKKTLNDYAKWRKREININVVEKRAFDTTKLEMPDKFINGIVLRDYQQEAVDEFLRNKIGILEIATGAGKTEIAIEIIRRRAIKTLFIVDKVELLRQTKERMEKALGIKIGQIGQGVQDIRNVTVATVQTLTKHRQVLSPYLKKVRLCIFDECHKVAAKSYWQISQHLVGSQYRLGLSGTSFRDDGNDMQIWASTGYIIHKLNSEKLIKEGWLVKPQIKFIKNYMSKDEVKKTEQSLKTGLINETPNYANFYKGFISGNARRNLLVRNIIEKHKGEKILILTKLIEHGEDIQKLIPGSEHLYGSTSKKEREEMFNNFVNGSLDVLISTISIWSEGLDCKPLSVIINLGANAGNVKTIQMLGRVLRTLEGKKNAYYYDFIDETKFFKLASFKRKRALIQEGHKINIVGEL